MIYFYTTILVICTYPSIWVYRFDRVNMNSLGLTALLCPWSRLKFHIDKVMEMSFINGSDCCCYVNITVSIVFTAIQMAGQIHMLRV